MDLVLHSIFPRALNFFAKDQLSFPTNPRRLITLHNSEQLLGPASLAVTSSGKNFVIAKSL